MADPNDADMVRPFVLLNFWEETLDGLLDRTAKFPRSARFILSARIDNLALDIMERLIEARYTRRGRADRLDGVNLSLEKLRVMLRLSHKRGYLSHKAYEHTTRRVNEAGRMVGGWRKHPNAQG